MFFFKTKWKNTFCLINSKNEFIRKWKSLTLTSLSKPSEFVYRAEAAANLLCFLFCTVIFTSSFRQLALIKVEVGCTAKLVFTLARNRKLFRNCSKPKSNVLNTGLASLGSYCCTRMDDKKYNVFLCLYTKSNHRLRYHTCTVHIHENHHLVCLTVCQTANCLPVCLIICADCLNYASPLY